MWSIMLEDALECKEVWYRTPSEFERLGGVRLLRLGRNLAKPTYRIGPRRTGSFMLHIVLEGELRFEQSSAQAVLHQGDLFCLIPGYTHEYSIHHPSKPLRLTWMMLEGSQVATLLEGIGITPQQPYRLKPPAFEPERSLARLASAYKRTLEPGQHAAELDLQSALYEFFYRLQLGTRSEANDWVERCRDYMQLHYADGITVADVAAFAGIHRVTLHKKFVERYSIDPRAYLKQLKLDKSEELLIGTDMSIGEIALSVGYPDLFSFTRAFRQGTGHSPTSMRKVKGVSISNANPH